MSIIDLLLGLILAGFVLWAIDAVVPMNSQVRKIIQVVVIGALILWILKLLGVVSIPIRLR